MQFVEFLVFIGRASHEIYNDNPPFDKLDLQFKIDHILIPLLAIPPLHLTKLYSIEEWTRVQWSIPKFIRVTFQKDISHK